MALIKCPECGKENVSNSAEMCPNCGFGIRKYFEKVKDEKNEEIQKKHIDIEEEEWSKQFTIEMVEEEISNDYKAKKISIILIIIGLIIEFISLVANLGLSIIGLLLIASGIFGLILYSSSITAQKNKLNLIKSDYGSYKEQLEKRNQLEILRYEQEQSKKLKCPICNSTNIERISTTSRAISVATVGLASGKIGKQYKCKNCKHMW